MKKRWYIGCALGCAFILGSAALATNNSDVLGEVKQVLKEDYVSEITADQLKLKTVDELLKSLNDPYTTYMKKEAYKEFIDGIEQTFSGIGVYIEMEKTGIRILEPIKNSPAESAGLLAGDLIIEAKGKSLEGMSNDEAISLVRGEAGTYVTLKIKRGTSTFDVNVRRENITMPIITTEHLDGHIGYIDVNSFGNDTAIDFGEAIKSLKKDGVDSWIVDLRSNGGGYLWTARAMAGFFIDTDTVVKIKNKTRETEYYGFDFGDIGDAPVVFLINQYSASASEVLAAAIKDHEKATMVGNISFGKGSVQTGYTLSNGDVLKVTIDHFYSPLGNQINHIGITPDLNTGKVDAKEVARLLFSGSEKDKADIKYLLGPNMFYIDDKKIVDKTYGELYRTVFNPEKLDYTQVSELNNLADKWWKAYMVDDKAKMDSIHKEAEKIRQSAGISNGADGSKLN